MNGRNRDYCREWLKKADHDLITARSVLSLEDGPTDTPCFHAQQAVEKAVKGMLTFHGAAFGRTHDLLALFDLVSPFLPELARFRRSTWGHERLRSGNPLSWRCHGTGPD